MLFSVIIKLHTSRRFDCRSIPPPLTSSSSLTTSSVLPLFLLPRVALSGAARLFRSLLEPPLPSRLIIEVFLFFSGLGASPLLVKSC